jgi:hypothetical protein
MTKPVPVTRETVGVALVIVLLSILSAAVLVLGLEAALQVFSESKSGLSTQQSVATGGTLFAAFVAFYFNLWKEWKSRSHGRSGNGNATSASGSVVPSSSSSEESTKKLNKFSRHYAILAISVAVSVASVCASATHALVTYYAFPQGTAGKDVHWTINNLQTIALVPFTFVLVLIVGMMWQSRLPSRTPVGILVRCAFVGAMCAALIAAFHVTPELLGLIRDSGYHVDPFGIQMGIKFENWLVIQRVLIVPPAAVVVFVIGFQLRHDNDSA